MKSSTPSLPRTGEGIVIDLGTGDGRFVSRAARANPTKFYIGVDPSVKGMLKPSMRATRKPAKGGLPNLMFVQASLADLRDEFDGVADEVHIHFPWGSLLRAVAAGDEAELARMRRICAPRAVVEIVVGLDGERDRAEIERLRLPELTPSFVRNTLAAKFQAAGFALLECRSIERGEWAEIESSWARKLAHGPTRKVIQMVLSAR